MLCWSYLLQGPKGTPYEDGWYWGRLHFPENYPLAPPSVMIHTPSGRFQPDTKLCLSVSDFHPENWKPAWGFATVLEGLRIFMAEDTPTVGSIDPLPPVEERRRLAAASAAWNSANLEFRCVFPDTSTSASAEEEDSRRSLLLVGEKPRGASQPDDEACEEKTPSEFSCGVCLRLLFEPVSISCGHTFCRGCLTGALNYLSKCPTCEAPFVGGQSVNVVVQSLIAQQCPKGLAKRKAVVGDAVEGRRSVACAGEVVPLLRVKDVFIPFPHASAKLDLDSREAEAAVEHAIRGARRILVLGFSNSKDFASFGCCAEIQAVDRAELGSASSVRIQGKCRCRLAEETKTHVEGAFEFVRIEYVNDDALPQEELVITEPNGAGRTELSSVSALQIANDALDLMDARLADVGSHGQNLFQARFGRAPVPQDGAITTASVEHLSFWLASALAAPADRRKLWLLSTNTRLRLEDCKAFLIARRYTALNLPGAESWMNLGGSGLGSVLLLLIVALLLAAKAMSIF